MHKPLLTLAALAAAAVTSLPLQAQTRLHEAVMNDGPLLVAQTGVDRRMDRREDRRDDRQDNRVDRREDRRDDRTDRRDDRQDRREDRRS